MARTRKGILPIEKAGEQVGRGERKGVSSSQFTGPRPTLSASPSPRTLPPAHPMGPQPGVVLRAGDTMERSRAVSFREHLEELASHHHDVERTAPDLSHPIRVTVRVS